MKAFSHYHVENNHKVENAVKKDFNALAKTVIL